MKASRPQAPSFTAVSPGDTVPPTPPPKGTLHWLQLRSCHLLPETELWGPLLPSPPSPDQLLGDTCRAPALVQLQSRLHPEFRTPHLKFARLLADPQH